MIYKYILKRVVVKYPGESHRMLDFPTSSLLLLSRGSFHNIVMETKSEPAQDYWTIQMR